jgi:hypothetical protein
VQLLPQAALLVLGGNAAFPAGLLLLLLLAPLSSTAVATHYVCGNGIRKGQSMRRLKKNQGSFI